MRHRILLLTTLLTCAISARAQYPSIDRHARRAPAALSDDIVGLAEYLTEPAANEREKARAIYTWVVGHLSYDRSARDEGRRINQSIRDILQRRRGLCGDYARLYQALCERAGLSCVIVDGYASPSLDERQLPEEANHSWNAVFADGRWRLVDATWGEERDELLAVYADSYFDTPPELFVLNHLPEQPMWQLLACPAGVSDYQQPAETLRRELAEKDSCLAYADSIAALLKLPEAEQRLEKARRAYRFHPTAANARHLGHALIDYAARLDEKSEQLPMPDSLGALARQQALALQAARQAEQLTELHDWQQQLIAQLHLNHAIALYQQSEELDKPLLESALRYAQEGQKRLQVLPETDFYRNYALPQCNQLLERLDQLLDR